MLLAVDIGNSHITLGVWNEEKLAFTARMVTDSNRTEDLYAVDIRGIIALNNAKSSDINESILCSVVPGLTEAMADAIEKATGVKSIILGPGIKTGINIKIDNPAQLGSDLVAGAVAAIEYYPLPCIIFDLGTATTISVIDENANFLGGSICAGIGITLDALASRTALLPNVNIEKPKFPIGTNTVASMQSGLIYGTAAMLDGMAERIEEQLGEKATLVATGGLASIVVPACKRKFIYNDNLLLDGLRIIYKKIKSK